MFININMQKDLDILNEFCKTRNFILLQSLSDKGFDIFSSVVRDIMESGSLKEYDHGFLWEVQNYIDEIHYLLKLAIKDLPDGWIIKNRLGAGYFGSVFISCIFDSCEYAMKIPVTNKEYDFSKRAGELGIGPKVIMYGGLTPENGYMIMEKINGVVLNKKSVDDIVKYFTIALDKYKELTESGIFQNDLNSDNVMIDTKGNVFIIDYGLAENYPYEREHMLSMARYLLKNTKGAVSKKNSIEIEKRIIL